MGIVPGDLHFFYCTSDGDHLRNLLNTSGGRIRPIIEPRQFTPTNVQLSPDELDVGGILEVLTI